MDPGFGDRTAVKNIEVLQKERTVMREGAGGGEGRVEEEEKEEEEL